MSEANHILSAYEAHIIERLCLNEPVDPEELAQITHPGAQKVCQILLNNPDSPTKALAEAVQADPELRETMEQAFNMPSGADGKRAILRGLRPRNMAQWMTEDVRPIKWLVDGLIADNSMMILAGRPKAGKSWLTLELGKCLDAGEPFLGRATRKSRVLVLTLEDGEERARRRCHALAWQPRESEIDFELSPLGGDGLGIQQIEGAARLYDVIIVDSLIRALDAGVNENDNVQMAAILNGLAGIAHRARTAIIVVHHTNKAGGEDIFNSLRGASSMRAAYDVGMILQREAHQPEGTLFVESRDEDVKPIAIRQRANGAGWDYLGSAHVQSMKVGRKVVVAMLELDPDHEGLTVEVIAAHRGITLQAVRKQLATAAKRGYVYRERRVPAEEDVSKAADLWFVAESYRG